MPLLDAATTAQLKTYLGNLRHPIELVASLGDDAKSADTRGLVEEIAVLSDKVSARFDGIDARRPSFAIGRFLWVRGDQQTIDRLGPDGVAAAVAGGSRAAARFQSGYVYSYALVMLIGLAAAAAWFLPLGLGVAGK